MALLAIYNDVESAINGIVDSNGEKVFCHFDIWNEQPSNEEGETPIDYPAVFIEFSGINWGERADAGGYQTDITEEQHGLLSTLKLHIVHSSLEGASISFAIMHPKNQQVYYAIQSISETDLHSRLHRTTEVQDPNHDRVQDWQMDFTFTMVQTGQVFNKTTIEAGSLTQTLTDG